MKQREQITQRIFQKTGQKAVQKITQGIKRNVMQKAGCWGLFILGLLLCTGLACTGCSSLYTASKIQLMKTEGTVDIANGRGEEVSPVPDMKLYSGYHMETMEASYAWLNLDSMRLAKMDVSSQISIDRKKEGLEIFVDSGSLFFNIKEPLKEDETLNIRTSNMAVGIRGTCGWVSVPEGEGSMMVYLLEGTVICEADGKWEAVRAGEMAVMNENGEISISDFTVLDIPAFVEEELETDEELRAAVLEASGLDVMNPSGPEDGADLSDSSETQNLSDVDEALARYREIISRASSYYYGTSRPGDVYRYALVQMQAGDTVPTLLLSQRERENGIDYIRVFQYDPASQMVHQPEESVMEGVASAGGFRGSLAMQGDGNGLRHVETSSGSGHTIVSRVTLAGDTLRVEAEWEGRLDYMPDAVTTPIDWYDIRETEPLDSWAPMASFNLGMAAPTETIPVETTPVETTPAETIPAETTPAETTLAELVVSDETIPPDQPDLDETLPTEESTVALPTDEDRIVFTGTIGTYNREQVMALQGLSPNQASYFMEGNYQLLVLDNPQSMTLESGDGYGSYSGNVQMIEVSGAGLGQYEGQHLTFSINPNHTYWPTDVSLPSGQPWTSDIHVLN